MYGRMACFGGQTNQKLAGLKRRDYAIRPTTRHGVLRLVNPQLTSAGKAAAIDLVTELIAIPGGPGNEAAVAARIKAELVKNGFSARNIRHDKANLKTRVPGPTGNLIACLSGKGKLRNAPRRMLSTHMDTVPLCVGAEPVRKSQNRIVPGGNTALGADNRSGCASILTAMRELHKSGCDHPPLTLLFTVQEEVGLSGAQHLDASLLRSPQVAINVDGGDPAELVIGAIGGRQWKVEIQGVASHAGCHPEDGASAASVFALAQASLVEGGWHGKVVQGRNAGSANIGSLDGGDATNVVMDRLTVTGECRSHSKSFLDRMMRTYERAFVKAASKIRNAAGEQASVEFGVTNAYPPFAMSKRSASVAAVVEAVKVTRRSPTFRIINGGLDANCLSEIHGIPSVTIGAGAHDIHTVKEYLDVREYIDACKVLVQFGTGS